MASALAAPAETRLIDRESILQNRQHLKTPQQGRSANAIVGRGKGLQLIVSSLDITEKYMCSSVNIILDGFRCQAIPSVNSTQRSTATIVGRLTLPKRRIKRVVSKTRS